MSFTLVLNSANAYGSQNNTFKYDFIQGNFNIPPDSEVMVANAQIPYSFYNITSAYNNNAFTLSFPTASATWSPKIFKRIIKILPIIRKWGIDKMY